MCFGFKSGRDKDARIPILSELLFIPKVATFVLVAAAMSVSLAAGSSAPASARVRKESL